MIPYVYVLEKAIPGLNQPAITGITSPAFGDAVRELARQLNHSLVYKLEPMYNNAWLLYDI